MEAVTRRGPSRWKRLSVPTARLNTLRGLTRSGLWSSFSWLGKGPYPPCGSVISLDVTVPLVPSGLVQGDAEAPQRDPSRFGVEAHVVGLAGSKRQVGQPLWAGAERMGD